MKGEDFSNRNYYYVPVSVQNRFPPEGIYVSVVDTRGEIAIYKYNGQYQGWSMRDAMGINSPDDNCQIVCWLEKRLIIS